MCSQSQYHYNTYNIIIIIIIHMFRIYLEGELHITIKKETSDNAIQLKFSPTPQFDVGTEGKIVEQMERKIHCDH